MVETSEKVGRFDTVVKFYGLEYREVHKKAYEFYDRMKWGYNAIAPAPIVQKDGIWETEVKHFNHCD